MSHYYKGWATDRGWHNFMAFVGCWQSEINARLVLRLYERRDAARDERDKNITAWDGSRWVLIR